DLGKIDGLRLTFTDAAVHDGCVFFAAAAEDSPDATRDGRVSGSALGVFDPGGGMRWTPLIGEDGTPFAGKVEGLMLRDAASAWVLVDRDDPLRPSELCEVMLEGDWMG
ncbi:MAG TPA: hypothetical protein VEW03_03825, partial [Longimicrobiaceae bacterium]|nr:hypothetical protein [Longimicrobiaceae bacterium]